MKNLGWLIRKSTLKPLESVDLGHSKKNNLLENKYGPTGG